MVRSRIKRGKAKAAKAKAKAAEAGANTARANASEAETSARAEAIKAAEAAKAEEAAAMDDECQVAETMRLKEQETQCEEEWFAARFRRHWDMLYAFPGVRAFNQTTSIPAMGYTYPASDDGPMAMDGLQIISVKIASIKESLQWPLQVFGFVAARDVLDHKRNIIFHLPRDNCQTITQEDPFLALTGPTRAIAVSTDLSYVEVSLKVKGATKPEDKDLSDLVIMYRAGCLPRGVYPSRLSTLELKFDRIARSVEATVCIKLKGGSSWPLCHRGVFSAAICTDDDLKVKLLDSRDDGLPVDADGVIKLSRRVVSVGLATLLKISVMASSINKDQVVECSEATFEPARAGISINELGLGFCRMEVSVAWPCFCYEGP